MKAHQIKKSTIQIGGIEVEYDDVTEYEEPVINDNYQYTVYRDYVIRMKPGGPPEISQRLQFSEINKNNQSYREIMSKGVN